MCFLANGWLISINNKTGSDPPKCPEVMPITENVSLSVDTYESMSDTNCYIEVSFFCL